MIFTNMPLSIKINFFFYCHQKKNKKNATGLFIMFLIIVKETTQKIVV